MTKYTFCFLLVGLTSMIHGQSGKTNAEKDPKATVILDKLKKQYKAYTSMEVQFELDMELPGRAKEVQKGTVIQQGKKFQVKMTDQEMYCDGNATWIYFKKNKEVQVLDASESSAGGFMSPQDMMLMYEKGEFSYTLAEERSVKGQHFADIEFKPVNKFAEYAKLRMTVDKKSNKMLSLRVFSKDGSRFTLSIKSLIPNKKYAPATFSFNPKSVPGIHVEDLRMNE